MAQLTILPDPGRLHLLQLCAEGSTITALVAPQAAASACPLCGRSSAHIHSHYRRSVADVPWHGVAMHLALCVRRFFCDNAACRRHIFTERLPGIVAPYARRTQRLEAWFSAVGFALGGEAGARLLRALGLVASPDTLLARIRATPLPPAAPPRILAVDDWSFRKGRTFGTILVDLERHLPIDLLPDREATTLATWLRAHPGIAVISRDRAGAYADGARQGAPYAVQVADRWHLLHNLWEALDGFFVHRKRLLQAAHTPPHQQVVEETPWLTGRSQRYEAASRQRHQRFVAWYHQIHDLAAKRVDIRAIAQRLGVSRGTV
jgi:transposase